jgi:hypothetical protein
MRLYSHRVCVRIADALDSNAINDCGLYMNSVNVGSRYDGTFPGPPSAANTRCAVWNDWDKWNQTIKGDLKQVMMSSMDALQVRTRYPPELWFLEAHHPLPRRTTSSGPGRSPTPLLQAKSKPPSGRTSLVWNKAGYPRTPARPMDSATASGLGSPNSPASSSHGKSVATVRMSSPPSTTTSGP